METFKTKLRLEIICWAQNVSKYMKKTSTVTNKSSVCTSFPPSFSHKKTSQGFHPQLRDSSPLGIHQDEFWLNLRATNVPPLINLTNLPPQEVNTQRLITTIIPQEGLIFHPPATDVPMFTLGSRACIKQTSAKINGTTTSLSQINQSDHVSTHIHTCRVTTPARSHHISSICLPSHSML